MLKNGDVILENKFGDKQVLFVRWRGKGMMVQVRNLSTSATSRQLSLGSLLAHTPANTWTEINQEEES